MIDYYKLDLWGAVTDKGIRRRRKNLRKACLAANPLSVTQTHSFYFVLRLLF